MKQIPYHELSKDKKSIKTFGGSFRLKDRYLEVLRAQEGDGFFFNYKLKLNEEEESNLEFKLSNEGAVLTYVMLGQLLTEEDMDKAAEILKNETQN